MKLYNLLLASTALALPLSAKANFLCASSDESVKVQTYELSGEHGSDGPVAFGTKKAAAVVKVSSETSLAVGKVEDVPNRVGGKKLFTLADDNDFSVQLTTVTTFTLLPCTRAGCPAPLESTKGTLKKDGETHVLVCTANTF